MKFWLFLVLLLAICATLCNSQWSSEEEEVEEDWNENEEEQQPLDGDEVEADENEGDEEDFQFSPPDLIVESVNGTEENIQQVLKRLQTLERESRWALLYLNEKLEATEEEVELNKDSLTSTDAVTRTCGGFVELSQVHNIIYRVPDEAVPGDYVACVWLVWADKGGPIGLQVVYNELAVFHKSFKLAVTYGFTVNGSYSQELDLDEEGSFEGQFIGIFFYGNLTERGQGVHIQLWDSGEVNSDLDPNVIIFPPESDNDDDDDNDEEEKSLTERGPQKFYYPGNGTDYGTNERLFIIGNPLFGGVLLNTTISSVDTEQCCDWITILYMDPDDPDLIQSELRRGSGAEVEDVVMTMDDKMPFLIFFSSDGHVHGKGFQLTYEYYQ